MRPDLPGPMRRRGPRPLPLHLAMAGLSSTPCAPASTTWSADWPVGNVADPALIAGIAAYRRHPYQRAIPDPPMLWSDGNARLLDYGAAAAGERPVLVVPSLINRAYILDLLPEHSALRFLASRNLRPLLLDWGYPDAAERRLTLTDLVAGRLERALAAVGEPAAVLGYCMGGLLATALAARRPERVTRLALLATPWDFSTFPDGRAAAAAALLPALEPVLAATGALPPDWQGALFALLDPGGVGAKYRDFASQDPASPRARRFVAIEDWLSDGVPLAAPVARECLADWFGANTPGRGEWRVADAPVCPETVTVPTFVAIPRRDRIVPEDTARPLAGAFPAARVIAPDAGHIGMVAGARAEAALWRELAAFLSG